MDAHSRFSMILTTVDSKEKAEELAKSLIKNSLAACVQISPILSLYQWDNRFQRDNEYLLRIKSRSSLYSEIEKFIAENHPYDTPQIVEVPITQGLSSYLDWIEENTIP